MVAFWISMSFSIAANAVVLSNDSKYEAYTCPEGFDCWNQNSCPSLTAECPPGFFCADPANFVSLDVKGEDELERDSWCPQGLVCNTPSEATSCPKEKWCDVASTKGSSCDTWASCPEGSYVQGRFAPLMGVLVVMAVLGVLSCCDPGIRRSAALAEEGNDIFPPILFSAQKVSVTLPNGKVILHPLTAEFVAGELVAIMGPSGSGKSTVMRALMTNQHGGSLRINGKLAAETAYKSHLGFVPQDDILDATLTPREALTYSAQTRLPHDWTSSMIDSRVDSVLRQLELTHVQDTRIGDEVRRGLSGGEKKRVSIGIELVVNPSAIFLDEPTSGLDASSSEKLTEILAGVAESGRCVVSVIHQPRADSFRRFHKLLLLGHGGKIVFFGRTDKVDEYFSSLDPSLKCPQNTNIANHILDIVSGIHDEIQHRKRLRTISYDHSRRTSSADFKRPSEIENLPVSLRRPKKKVVDNQTEGKNSSVLTHMKTSSKDIKSSDNLVTLTIQSEEGDGRKDVRPIIRQQQTQLSADVKALNRDIDEKHENDEEISPEVDKHIRTSWGIESTLQIFSEGDKTWFEGRIKEIEEDSEGEWLTVYYRNYLRNGRLMRKAVGRFSSHARPLKAARISGGDVDAQQDYASFRTMQNPSFPRPPSPEIPLHVRINPLGKEAKIKLAAQEKKSRKVNRVTRISKESKDTVVLRAADLPSAWAKHGETFTAKNLPIAWKNHQKEEDEKPTNMISPLSFSSRRIVRSAQSQRRYEARKEADVDIEKARNTSMSRTARAMCWRAIFLQLRDIQAIKVFTGLAILMAIALSVGFSPYVQGEYAFEPPLPEALESWCPRFLDCSISVKEGIIEQLVWFLNMNLAAITMMVGARLFSGDYLFVRREGEAGVSTALQGIVKILVDIGFVVYYSLVFTGVWVCFGHPGSFTQWITLNIALGFASSGVGAGVSLAVSREDSYLASVILGLFFAAFSGLYPRLKSLGGAQYIWSLSYARWSSEAAYTLYTDHMRDQGQDIQRGADVIGYTIGRFSTDVGVLFALGIAFRMITVFLLVQRIHGSSRRTLPPAKDKKTNAALEAMVNPRSPRNPKSPHAQFSPRWPPRPIWNHKAAKPYNW